VCGWGRGNDGFCLAVGNHQWFALRTAPGVEQFLVQILRLRIHVEPFTTQQAVRNVRQLAQTHRLTAYDAAYFELALCYNLPLATLDIELKQASFAVGVRLIA
jgi:predicted nucleic acid-binding protein